MSSGVSYRPLAALAAAGVLFLASAGSTLAASSPPPPPPNPGCKTCSGPPAPPTVVPTPAATVVVAAQPAVEVHLSPTHVQRGHVTKVEVVAGQDARITITVQYRKMKPVVYKAKVGSSGTFTKMWKVPRAAPVGKAQVKVEIDGTGDDKPFTTTVALIIIH